MQQGMFHGILVDMAFLDRDYPKTVSIFAQKKAGDWGLLYDCVLFDAVQEEQLLSCRTQDCLRHPLACAT
jgi:hypothetical protein